MNPFSHLPFLLSFRTLISTSCFPISKQFPTPPITPYLFLILFSWFAEDVSFNTLHQHPSLIWDNSLWMQRMAVVRLPLSFNALLFCLSFYWNKTGKYVSVRCEEHKLKIHWKGQYCPVKGGLVSPVPFAGGLLIWFLAQRDGHSPGLSVTQSDLAGKFHRIPLKPKHGGSCFKM